MTANDFMGLIGLAIFLVPIIIMIGEGLELIGDYIHFLLWKRRRKQ